MSVNRFILASQSPRRRQLLGLIDYPFEIMVADANEEQITDADPALNAVRTAQLKAETILARLDATNYADAIIIAADTTVSLDQQMLNKPADAAEARSMLLTLRDRTHRVHTGLALARPAWNNATAVYTTNGVHSAAVKMRAYTDAEIITYIGTGDPFDKAGAYAIQHPKFRPVAALEGCFLGVMGLSICHLIQLLTAFDVAMRVDWRSLAQAHQGYECPLYATIAQKFG